MSTKNLFFVFLFVFLVLPSVTIADELVLLRNKSAGQLQSAYGEVALNESETSIVGRAFEQLLAAEQWYTLAEKLMPKKMTLADMEEVNSEVFQAFQVAEEHARAANFLANKLPKAEKTGKEKTVNNPATF